MSYLKQAGYTVTFDWGLDGLSALDSARAITVIVDVLSFATCVSVAMDRNAEVFPYRFKDESAAAYAASVGAHLARSREEAFGLSLSPASMQTLVAGEKVVLPSPNGSTLCLESKGKYVVAGCLRNCDAVADFVNRSRLDVCIIAAGEKWPNGNLRYAIEDYLGAGSIISKIAGSLSPEAEMAAEAFERNRGSLREKIENSVSGRELRERGFPRDIEIACEIGQTDFTPILKDRRFAREPGEGLPPTSAHDTRE